MAAGGDGWPRLAHLTDRYGNQLTFGNCGDLWHPAYPIGRDTDYRRHVRQIRDMDIRNDDILICSYPKTGLHWTVEIVMMLTSKSSEYVDQRTESRYAFLDMRPLSVADSRTSPRVLTTHLPFRYVPRQAFDKKIKIIHLDRNPKDVLVSFYCQEHAHRPPLEFSGTFDQFFRLYFDCGYIYGHVFDYQMEFQEGMEAHPDVDVFTSIFEDMKQDPVKGVMDINEYLATGCSPELCQRIAEACHFEVLKPTRDSMMPDSAKARFKDDKPVLYRKGQVGDWKNWFTVAMDEEFDEQYAKWMAGYKRTYKYTMSPDA